MGAGVFSLSCPSPPSLLGDSSSQRRAAPGLPSCLPGAEGGLMPHFSVWERKASLKKRNVGGGERGEGSWGLTCPGVLDCLGC